MLHFSTVQIDKKMKRTLIILAATCSLSTAEAKWNTSDTDHTLIGAEGQYGQAVIHTATTPNGSTVVTWLKTPGINYDDPAFGYYLYMQIYDAEGNAIFPQEGKQVSGQPTDSWVSDYGLTCMENGDILIAYNDKRSGENRVYAYRYTEQGTSVWDAAGILIPSSATVNPGRDLAAQIVASDENIYVAFSHAEEWEEPATEENWQPNPWFPDEEMPEYVTIVKEEYQLLLLNAADGSRAWDKTVSIETSSLFTYPAPEGNVYSLYTDDICALYAEKITSDGANAWDEPVAISEDPLSFYGFLPSLEAAPAEDGSLAIALNVPNEWISYMAITKLSPDGETFFEPICGNEDKNTGLSSYAAIATRGDKTMAAWPWEYSSSQKHMWVNMFENQGAGGYAWQGDKQYGLCLDTNTDWGMKAVKVVPQANGWVVIYGNCTSWNGANFMVVKLNDEGDEMWRKQICEPDFKCSGLSVEADAKKAIIFYTCDMEYDSNWEPIVGEGGMFVMCVDLTNGEDPVGIQQLSTASGSKVMDLQGRISDHQQSGQTYIIDGKLRMMK